MCSQSCEFVVVWSNSKRRSNRTSSSSHIESDLTANQTNRSKPFHGCRAIVPYRNWKYLGIRIDQLYIFPILMSVRFTWLSLDRKYGWIMGNNASARRTVVRVATFILSGICIILIYLEYYNYLLLHALLTFSKAVASWLKHHSCRFRCQQFGKWL